MVVALGLLVGFCASLPPGPINIFSLSQALRFGFWKSVSIRLTVSVLDTIYCYAATIFSSLVVSLLNRWSLLLRLAASIVLVGAGTYLIRQARAHRIRQPELAVRPPRRGSPVALTFMLYVSSPTLPAFWLTVGTFFTSHGLVTYQGFKPILLALSCGSGSLIYYMLMARLGLRLKTTLTPKFFETASMIMGIALLGIAAFTLVTFILKLLGK